MGTNQAGNQARNVVACVASVSVRFWSQERGTRVTDRENGSCFISRMAKTKTPFCFFSLLQNQTETLATQAGNVGTNCLEKR